jgi:hypothetical protein
MSLSFNRDIVYRQRIPRRRGFSRPHINYNPASQYRPPHNTRFREPRYHPADWLIGDYLYGGQIVDILN